LQETVTKQLITATRIKTVATNFHFFIISIPAR